MIVVVGNPIGLEDDDGIRAGGTSSRVAVSAAAAGAEVQIVGRIGDDTVADGVVLDLAAHGVGHAALLRDGSRATPLSVIQSDTDDTALWKREPDPVTGTTTGPDGSGPGLDPTDVELGLRYLTDFQVVVLSGLGLPGLVGVVTEAARFAAARMIVIVTAGDTPPEGLPDEAIVVEAPDADPDGAFADLIGTLAARLERDPDIAAAFQASIASDGWETAPAD
jgi:sugar/nucleoside kinase (ribokinase family)